MDFPPDRIVTELASALRASVGRLKLLERLCFFGQLRCFTPDEVVEPHVDLIQLEFPSYVEAPQIQWAMNLALSRPQTGGELEIWPVRPTMDEYKGYGLRRPPFEPVLRYRPNIGDLYMFQSHYVHGISPSSEPRCAIAGFFAGPWGTEGYRVWS